MRSNNWESNVLEVLSVYCFSCMYINLIKSQDIVLERVAMSQKLQINRNNGVWLLSCQIIPLGNSVIYLQDIWYKVGSVGSEKRRMA